MKQLDVNAMGHIHSDGSTSIEPTEAYAYSSPSVGQPVSSYTTPLIGTTPDASSASFDDMQDFDEAQTFIIPKDRVFGVDEVTLDSIDLYFDMKPHATKNASGIKEPGVVIALCEVEDDKPRPDRVIKKTVIKKEHNDVNAAPGTDIKTRFVFDKPIKVKADKHHAVLVKFEDPGYKTCKNIIGVPDANTAVPSTGNKKSKHGGKHFRKSNDDPRGAKPVNDRDLKFGVNVKKLESKNDMHEVEVYNAPMEFLTVNTTASFLGGEYVWKDKSAELGKVKIQQGNTVIIGDSNSDFTALKSNHIVFRDRTGTRAGANADYDVLPISHVVNSTYMVVETPPSFDANTAEIIDTNVAVVHKHDRVNGKLHLVDSNASNSTFRFSANDTLVSLMTGAVATITSLDDLDVSEHVPMFKTRPGHPDVEIETEATFVNQKDDGTYEYDETKHGKSFKVKDKNKVKDYRPKIRSRSNEVNEPTKWTGADAKQHDSSVRKKIKFKRKNKEESNTSATSNTFVIPDIDPDEHDIIINQYVIDNVYTQTVNAITIDTEVAPMGGIAKSKHIAKKLTFANNRFAEDLRVYVSAYRPKVPLRVCGVGLTVNAINNLSATDVRVYAKIYNSQDPETFDDKSWTPLVITENADKYSSSDNDNDIIEYTYSLPDYSEAALTLPGTVTTEVGNTIMVFSGSNGSVTANASIAANDVVRIYSELFPENYQIAVVTASNTSTITLSEAVANNSMAGSGFKVDKVKYPNIAFNNIQNDNVVRYYNTSLAAIDTYDSVQIKVVLLSPSVQIVPEVDTIRVVGVSA